MLLGRLLSRSSSWARPSAARHVLPCFLRRVRLVTPRNVTLMPAAATTKFRISGSIRRSAPGNESNRGAGGWNVDRKGGKRSITVLRQQTINFCKHRCGPSTSPVNVARSTKGFAWRPDTASNAEQIAPCARLATGPGPRCAASKASAMFAAGGKVVFRRFLSTWRQHLQTWARPVNVARSTMTVAWRPDAASYAARVAPCAGSAPGPGPW